MAVKKTAKSGSAAKAAAPKAAPKKAAAAPKKAAAAMAAAPKAAPKQAAAPKKKAAPIKLTDRQTELLKRVQEAGESGYHPTRAETRSLEALQTRKLIKRGAKNKESGLYHFSVSRTGEKHLSQPPATAGE